MSIARKYVSWHMWVWSFESVCVRVLSIVHCDCDCHCWYFFLFLSVFCLAHLSLVLLLQFIVEDAAWVWRIECVRLQFIWWRLFHKRNHFDVCAMHNIHTRLHAHVDVVEKFTSYQKQLVKRTWFASIICTKHKHFRRHALILILGLRKKHCLLFDVRVFGLIVTFVGVSRNLLWKFFFHMTI